MDATQHTTEDTPMPTTHDIVTKTTSCASITVVAAILLLTYRWHARRLQLIDSWIERCRQALETDGADIQDADFIRIEWSETSNIDVRSLLMHACSDPDGIAVRTVSHIGTGVLVCDKNKNKAVGIVLPTSSAKRTLTTKQLQLRVFGRLPKA